MLGLGMGLCGLDARLEPQLSWVSGLLPAELGLSQHCPVNQLLTTVFAVCLPVCMSVCHLSPPRSVCLACHPPSIYISYVYIYHPFTCLLLIISVSCRLSYLSSLHLYRLSVHLAHPSLGLPVDCLPGEP